MSFKVAMLAIALAHGIGAEQDSNQCFGDTYDLWREGAPQLDPTPENFLVNQTFEGNRCEEVPCTVTYGDTTSFQKSCEDEGGSFYRNGTVRFGCKTESSFAAFEKYREYHLVDMPLCVAKSCDVYNSTAIYEIFDDSFAFEPIESGNTGHCWVEKYGVNTGNLRSLAGLGAATSLLMVSFILMI
eukprot:CAMPEP_0183316934 /NCGR_PEP_ID=MMETSP0160_2-20130417/56547_1 /TAXON_ID=2839 ORGANISM="Odontella Sinensis, Strain Grunow 1884" /NCGR_SAMPLE_ID=MMETSP0160_2 /ASSEMBLY_ACC=CAM_ASM_000250 /LENGTH=184 /DNA_ID=CAMNT_0025482845 /DNA_START=163 /DNA_END=717 /DNA_ORIENTATION=-